MIRILVALVDRQVDRRNRKLGRNLSLREERLFRLRWALLLTSPLIALFLAAVINAVVLEMTGTNYVMSLFGP